jgi:hypothetical protein
MPTVKNIHQTVAAFILQWAIALTDAVKAHAIALIFLRTGLDSRTFDPQFITNI